jgi:hypothetical protein
MNDVDSGQPHADTGLLPSRLAEDQTHPEPGEPPPVSVAMRKSPVV